MRSLRGRLTLGVLLVLAGVLLAAGIVASREVDRSELEAFDDRLRRTAELSRATARAAVQQELPEDDRRLDAVLDATRSSLRLLLGETVLLETGAPPPRRPELRPGFTTFDVGGEPYRAYVTSLEDPDLGGLARLEIIGSLESLEDRGRDLDRVLFGVAALALLVAGAGVWLTATIVLRPLRRLRDVTAQIAQDEDLDRRVPADGGPRELRSLAKSFNAMLARLGRSADDRRRALDATRRFAADAGHELRTPLTSVQASLSTVRRHWARLRDEQREEMLDEALAEHDRLVHLLDGLQALARGDAEVMERAPVDLAEVVDAVVPAPEVEVDVPDAPVVVQGWEPGLRVLVGNLVQNARRHGRPDGRVRVALDAEGVLTVDDDGPGIAEEDRGRIFEPFVRAAGTEAPGSGLGLALVAQQAGHHGATVEVGDSPLGGARFTVRFPVAG